MHSLSKSWKKEFKFNGKLKLTNRLSIPLIILKHNLSEMFVLAVFGLILISSLRTLHYQNPDLTTYVTHEPKPWKQRRQETVNFVDNTIDSPTVGGAWWPLYFLFLWRTGRLIEMLCTDKPTVKCYSCWVYTYSRFPSEFIMNQIFSTIHCAGINIVVVVVFITVCSHTSCKVSFCSFCCQI